jgi:hypothetical protein
MVWVVSLLATDLSTHSLTPDHDVAAFGVHQGLVGGEAP